MSRVQGLIPFTTKMKIVTRLTRVTGFTRIFVPMVLASLLIACGGESTEDDTGSLNSRELLGEALFSDTSLSFNRTQSCATCHNPDAAFTDNTDDGSGNSVAVSFGDDTTLMGDRNTPTVTYASLAPEFGTGTRTRFNSQQSDYSGYLGGQFHDGRASDLAQQAAGPFLNPVEMGMPDAASVIDRVLENSDYVEAFETLYGSDIFNDTSAAYEALTDAIAAFEQTDEFSSFDSAYDRYLDGDLEVYDIVLNNKAAKGKTLFFSQQFTNCATCHQLKSQSSAGETFTGYEYHNLGVPVNEAVRTANAASRQVAGIGGDDYVDTGLQNNNEAVTEATEAGKFKTPTLRNVAVTGPYMHNGVFKELDTVIRFYDHYLTGSTNTLNPETGGAWADPEVASNIALTELQDGSLLDDSDVTALVCFLRTLTDARYEHLIPDDGLCD
ncbi:MAG: cytochrome-c peroxidase [Oceanobacter sp.]